MHVNQLEAPANDSGPVKNLSYLLGVGIGRNVKILGHSTKDQVAHTTANQIAVEARTLQTFHHVQGAVAYARFFDTVVRCRIFNRIQR